MSYQEDKMDEQPSMQAAPDGDMPPGPQDSINPPPPGADQRSRVPCRFFLYGNCRNGDNCPYSHSDVEQIRDYVPPIGIASLEPGCLVFYGEPKLDEQEPLVSPDWDTITIPLSGAQVRFEAGASVTEAILLSDRPTVFISHLPRGSDWRSVKTLLGQCGYDKKNMKHIYVKDAGNGFAGAFVSTPDAQVARSVSATLAALATEKETDINAGPQPTATLINMPVVLDSCTFVIDCKKVHCSWDKPTNVVILRSKSKVVVDRVWKQLQDGTYAIKGQVGDCFAPFPEDGSEMWNITCLGVPLEMTEEDIRSSIPPRLNVPLHVEIKGRNYDVDADTCFDLMRATLEKGGRLDWWNPKPDTSGTRMRVEARYQTDESARFAAESLHDKPLVFNPECESTIKLVYSARFKVDAHIYRAVENQIMTHAMKWEASYMRFSVYGGETQPPQRQRVIKIEGEEADNVAEAKNTLADLLNGIAAKEGTSILWHESLMRSNNNLVYELELVQHTMKVLIVRDYKRQLLRLYGAPQKREEVQGLIARIIAKHKPGSETAITDADEESEDYEDSEEIQTVKLSFSSDSSNDSGHDSDNEDLECPVCTMEPEDPFHLDCGHVYCRSCLDHMFNAAIHGDTAVAVRCMAEDCNEPLQLPQLQALLSPAAFHELLAHSFAVYVQQHPGSLRHCPTPGCNTVYRPHSQPHDSRAERPGRQRCSGCLRDACAGCQGQHGAGVSCAAHAEAAVMAETRRRLGIQDCGRCGALLEKVGGCDHVRCPCGAHVCWACGEVFETETRCYEHMNEEHGQFDDEDAADGDDGGDDELWWGGDEDEGEGMGGDDFWNQFRFPIVPENPPQHPPMLRDADNLWPAFWPPVHHIPNNNNNNNNNDYNIIYRHDPDRLRRDLERIRARLDRLEEPRNHRPDTIHNTADGEEYGFNSVFDDDWFYE
ncbi:hypothetical protein GGR52DRAFT_586959 [Hypoxylon sp. FL1284]|nr:hypothetical protein GGR52DRAFT_586959 [Hypoxylon sp. FL1284]